MDERRERDYVSIVIESTIRDINAMRKNYST
jgi:hypothetical protein